MKYSTLQRGKITYYISDSAVVAKVSDKQYLSYNVYNNPSRSNLTDFKKAIKTSKGDEYGNAVDHMDLAQQCRVIGTSTMRPAWIAE